MMLKELFTDIRTESNLAVASVNNALTYWRQVGCSLFGKRNTFYYTLYDA